MPRRGARCLANVWSDTPSSGLAVPINLIARCCKDNLMAI